MTYDEVVRLLGKTPTSEETNGSKSRECRWELGSFFIFVTFEDGRVMSSDMRNEAM